MSCFDIYPLSLMAHSLASRFPHVRKYTLQCQVLQICWSGSLPRINWKQPNGITGVEMHQEALFEFNADSQLLQSHPFFLPEVILQVLSSQHSDLLILHE